MKWTQITIETTCEAVDLLSAFLDEEGVLGIEVDDNVPLTDEEMAAMFVDLLPDEMPTDDGTAKVSCYLDDSFDKEEIKTKIKNELERLSEFIPVGVCNIIESETEDVDIFIYDTHLPTISRHADRTNFIDILYTQMYRTRSDRL